MQLIASRIELGQHETHKTGIKSGVVKLALSDPQGVSEAFQGVYDR